MSLSDLMAGSQRVRRIGRRLKLHLGHDPRDQTSSGDGYHVGATVRPHSIDAAASKEGTSIGFAEAGTDRKGGSTKMSTEELNQAIAASRGHQNQAGKDDTMGSGMASIPCDEPIRLGASLTATVVGPTGVL